MSGFRQAALALHGLSGADREFVLNELPPADQTQLRQLLEELVDLGFSQDAAQSVQTDTQRHRHDQTAQAAEAVLRAFAAEPASFVGTALAVQPWPWTAAYLALLPPPRRQLVEQAMAAWRPAPARDAHVQACVQDALRVSAVAETDEPRPGLFATMVKRWKR
jgi:hypothetical protein